MSRTNPARKTPVLRITAVALVAMVSLGASAWGMANEPERPRSVIAEFADASPLLPGNDVKLNGVKVGEVSSISVHNGHADVSMTLQPEAFPMHSDASASVRPVSLLGERFVELKRGSPSAPALGAGDVIPVSRTGQNTDLDQVLNVLDDGTGESLAALVTVLGQGMQGNGRNTADTIKALAPAMTDAEGMARVLNEQNATLNHLVDTVTPVAQSLAADNGRTLDGLVDSANETLGTTTARQEALRATVAELPDTLEQARSTFATLAGTARTTTPTLREIRPATDNLAEISQEITRFSDAADPALARAQPVLDRAQSLLDEARPVAEQLHAAGPPLRAVAGSARPLAEQLGGNFNNVMNFVRGWALSTNGSDGIAHYFRALTIVTPEIATGSVPAPVAQAVPHLPDIPPPPGLGGPPNPGGGPPPNLGGLLSPETQPGSGVTGLTPDQEGGALDFLLGGN